MKRFVISEDERSRILSMHESATKRQYLSEQQGTKVADPNAKIYDTPMYKFLLDTNLPQFLAKNNVDLHKLIKAGARLDGDKNNFVWKPQGSNTSLFLPIFTGVSKYLDNYSGYKQKHDAAFKKVSDTFNGIKNDRNVQFYGCITDKLFHPSNPTQSIKKNDSNCKGYAAELDKVFKDTKLKELSNLAQIETFINKAPKFTA